MLLYRYRYCSASICLMNSMYWIYSISNIKQVNPRIQRLYGMRSFTDMQNALFSEMSNLFLRIVLTSTLNYIETQAFSFFSTLYEWRIFLNRWWKIIQKIHQAHQVVDQCIIIGYQPVNSNAYFQIGPLYAMNYVTDLRITRRSFSISISHCGQMI